MSSADISFHPSSESQRSPVEPAAASATKITPKHQWLRRTVLGLAAMILACALVLLWTAGAIYFYSGEAEPAYADAAIVLGAAIWGKEPSPVFKERINHAVELYENGRVGKVVLTGGFGEGSKLADSVIAKKYALKKGLPEQAIIVETHSTTTKENLLYTLEATADKNMQSFLIVSDPLHMRRAMLMAHDLRMNAFASPTKTTRYRTLHTQLRFLTHETYYYWKYRVARLLGY